MSVPDRDLVREALTRFEMPGCLGVDRRTDLDSLVAAARAWLEQGNAIIIHRDADGQWPERVKRIVARAHGDPVPVLDGLSVEGDQP